jgi:hypothetical protein
MHNAVFQVMRTGKKYGVIFYKKNRKVEKQKTIAKG